MALRKLGLLALLFSAGIGCSDATPRPAAGGAGGAGGTGGGGGTAGYGLDQRPANPGCIAPAAPPGPANVKVVRAFPALAFTLPLDLVQASGRPGRWYAVEKAGRVWTFEDRDDVAAATVALDLTDRVSAEAREAGLLGLVFDPKSGAAIASYTAARGGGLLRTVLSRFTSTDGGLTYDRGTEQVLLTIDREKDYHNGGHVAFGPDGYLYFADGDGGDGSNGKGLQTLMGKVLRLDVSGPGGYTVPPDNPFAGGGGLPEIWAYGFRNPWRFSFDPAGQLWLADVGEAKWEEVDLVEKGGDYGWDTFEGLECRVPGACHRPNKIDPIWVYSHEEGRSITGGFVYRGAAMPELRGTYVFGDFAAGKIWGLTRPAGGGPASVRLLLESGLTIPAFGEALDGELYVIDHVGGGIYRLVHDDGGGHAFPGKLSATGCVDPADPTRPAAGLIPYDVNVPLWSDAAQKDRYFAIPDGATIDVLPDGDLDLPVGSVTMKTFYVQGRRVETRLLVRHQNGNWAGYTYEWNADETDAVLLPDRKTVDVNGQSWTMPSRGECLACHTAAAGRTLGFEQAQLNRTIRWPNGRDANLLDTLAHIGLFARDPGPAAGLPNLAAQPPGRAYLHANCSYCHRPDGTGQGNADYRFETPLPDMHVCDVEPQKDLGLADAKIVAPGDPAHSVLLSRMRDPGPLRMPPLGTAVVDDHGSGLVEDWIHGLSSCEAP
jgi:uncharacterized repeat protein (TIGR03806 family)